MSQTTTLSASSTPRLRALFANLGPWFVYGIVFLLLMIFLVIPMLLVFYTAFVTETGAPTLGHFMNFFGQAIFKESFINSLIVAFASVVFASLIAIPLAYFTVRFEFRGAILIQTLGVLPLIMPPFVGAVAMQLIFGKNPVGRLVWHQHSLHAGAVGSDLC